MSAHSEIRELPYSADLMFEVVADVEKYPLFLPWCTGLRVLSREHVKSRDVVTAEMQVRFGPLHERYTSRIILDPAARTIDVTQTSGPFRRLENHWRFSPAEGGSRVEFRIAFEFRNRLLNAVAAGAFERVQFKMADAFESRARALSKKAL